MSGRSAAADRRPPLALEHPHEETDRAPAGHPVGASAFGGQHPLAKLWNPAISSPRLLERVTAKGSPGSRIGYPTRIHATDRASMAPMTMLKARSAGGEVSTRAMATPSRVHTVVDGTPT